MDLENLEPGEPATWTSTWVQREGPRPTGREGSKDNPKKRKRRRQA